MRRWIAFVRNSDTVRYFIGKGVLLWPLNILALALGFVSTILYARLLTPEQYGEFSYVMAMMLLLNPLSLPGINIAVAQAAAQEFDGFIALGTRVRLRFSLFGTVAMAVIGLVCWHSKGPVVAISCFIAAAVFPVFNSFDNCWAILTGKKQFEMFAKLRLAGMLTTTGATWLALLWTRSVPWVFAANVSSAALTQFIFYHVSVRRFKANERVNPESLRYGKRLTWLDVIGSIEWRADQVVVGTFLPFAELGWFNMASRIKDAIIQETWNVAASLLFPRLAECSDQEARRRVRVWRVYLIVAFIALAVLFWVFASWLLPLILGPAYVQSVRLSRWLVVIWALGSAWLIFEVYCKARAAEKTLWIARLVLTGTHLMILMLLIKPLGLTGVLISVAGARVAVTAAVAVMSGRNHSRLDGGTVA